MKCLLKVYNLSSKNMCEKLVGWKSLPKVEYSGKLVLDTCPKLRPGPVNLDSLFLIPALIPFYPTSSNFIIAVIYHVTHVF